jgi:hypothetical protein
MSSVSNKSERPIFIVGVHRSGTTLLRYMLNSNPRIHIPPESDFIPYFFGRQPTESLSDERIAQILNVIFTRYRFVREWQGEPPDLVQFIDSMPDRTPAAFLNTLYRAYASQNNADRWGDKTPIYTSYIDLINKIFPQAQFIHLIRDGRDVALSMLETWGPKDFHIDIYFTARNWVYRTCLARNAGLQLGPDRYYELRYEHLVQDPERELRPLCEFLNEVYLPAMAEPHRLGRTQIAAGSFHAPIRNPPNPHRIKRWQQEMTQPDLRLFQHLARDLLADLNYSLADAGTMSTKERIRFSTLHTKYIILQIGRRILQSLGVFPPI